MQNIPVNTPDLSGNEKKYLIDCIDSGWISSEGPYVKKFEDNFSKYIGVQFGVAVSSGTAAMDVLVDYLDLKTGDEVIVPSFTIVSVIAQIVRSGATPIFADCDPVTWNITIDEIERLLSARTRAVIVVHTYGHPVDMDPIVTICQHKGIFLIEDAAEMHGQTYKDRLCGSLADASIFSFYPNKHLTTGEGGMVLTNNSEVNNHVRSARNLFFGSKRYVHERLGWNYRMTNMQAAIGCAQLERLNLFVERKREIGRKYRSAFKGIQSIQMLPQHTEYSESIDWVFAIVLTGAKSENRDSVCQFLGEKGIGTRSFFHPLHLQPFILKEFGVSPKLPECEKIAQGGFYIPAGLGMTDDQQTHVIGLVQEALK
jgi:perosamine synthetase